MGIWAKIGSAYKPHFFEEYEGNDGVKGIKSLCGKHEFHNRGGSLEAVDTLMRPVVTEESFYDALENTHRAFCFIPRGQSASYPRPDDKVCMSCAFTLINRARKGSAGGLLRHDDTLQGKWFYFQAYTNEEIVALIREGVLTEDEKVLNSGAMLLGVGVEALTGVPRELQQIRDLLRENRPANTLMMYGTVLGELTHDPAVAANLINAINQMGTSQERPIWTFSDFDVYEPVVGRERIPLNGVDLRTLAENGYRVLLRIVWKKPGVFAIQHGDHIPEVVDRYTWGVARAATEVGNIRMYPITLPPLLPGLHKTTLRVELTSDETHTTFRSDPLEYMFTLNGTLSETPAPSSCTDTVYIQDPAPVAEPEVKRSRWHYLEVKKLGETI